MKAGSGSGTVTSSPTGINCGSDCTHAYERGTVVTLTGRHDSNSEFDGWSGDSDCNDGRVTMNSDRSCTATFQRFNRSPVGGSITISPTGVGLASATIFQFTASGVTDPDGDAITYFWEFGDGSGNPPSAPTVSKTYPRAQTYPVRLGVTDNKSPVRLVGQIDLLVRDLTGTWDGFIQRADGSRNIGRLYRTQFFGHRLTLRRPA